MIVLETERLYLREWVLAVQQTFGTAQNDGKLKDGIDLSPSVVNLLGAAQ